MAIYKGRIVTITNYVQPGLTVPETIQVVDQAGQSYSPKIGELQYTEAEKADLQKYHSDKFDQINVISDKDLKAIQDEANPEVIEKRKEDEDKNLVSPTPVTVVAPDAKVKAK